MTRQGVSSKDKRQAMSWLRAPRRFSGRNRPGDGCAFRCCDRTGRGPRRRGGVLVELVGSQTVLASDNFDLEDPADGSVVALTGPRRGDIQRHPVQRLRSWASRSVWRCDEEGFEARRFRYRPVLHDDGSRFRVRTLRGLPAQFDNHRNSRRRRCRLLGDLRHESGNTYGYGARLLLCAEGPFTFALEGERPVGRIRLAGFLTRPTRAPSCSTVRCRPPSIGRRCLRVTAGYTETDEDDPADTFETTTSVGLGITRALGNATSRLGRHQLAGGPDPRQWEPTSRTVSAAGWPSTATCRTAPLGASAERVITVDGGDRRVPRQSHRSSFHASALGLEAGIVITGGDTVSPRFWESPTSASPPDGAPDVLCDPVRRY